MDELLRCIAFALDATLLPRDALSGRCLRLRPERLRAERARIATDLLEPRGSQTNRLLSRHRRQIWLILAHAGWRQEFIHLPRSCVRLPLSIHQTLVPDPGVSERCDICHSRDDGFCIHQYRHHDNRA